MGEDEQSRLHELYAQEVEALNRELEDEIELNSAMALHEEIAAIEKDAETESNINAAVTVVATIITIIFLIAIW